MNSEHETSRTSHDNEEPRRDHLADIHQAIRELGSRLPVDHATPEHISGLRDEMRGFGERLDRLVKPQPESDQKRPEVDEFVAGHGRELGVTPDHIQGLRDDIRGLSQRVEQHLGRVQPEPDGESRRFHPEVERFLAERRKQRQPRSEIARVSNARLIKQIKKRK